MVLTGCVMGMLLLSGAPLWRFLLILVVVGSGAVMLAVGAESYLEIFERPDDPLDAGRLLHLALRVDDCRAAHAAAIEAGAREKMAPTEVEIPADPPFPVTISFVLGPDGEEIELFQER